MNINGLLVCLIGKVARGNMAAKFTTVLMPPCAPGFVGCCFYLGGGIVWFFPLEIWASHLFVPL